MLRVQKILEKTKEKIIDHVNFIHQMSFVDDIPKEHYKELYKLSLDGIKKASKEIDVLIHL